MITETFKSLTNDLCFKYVFSKKIILNDYKNAKKIYSINLIKGNFRRINNDLVNIYNFKNESNKRIDDGNIELFLIRLDKVNNIQYTINEERFIRWLRIINATSYEELSKYCEGDEIMSEANKFVAEWCKESNKNGFERYIAEREAEAASKATVQGKKAGILETAKNLISLNIDLNDISKATGLSISELQKLQAKMN